MSLEPIVVSLVALNKRKLAVEVLEAFGERAFSFEENDDLAKSAFKINEYNLAIRYGEDCLANALTNEKMWMARSNLINVYNHANYPEKALRLIKANEAVIPGDADTRLEKAFSLYLTNRRDEAEEILRSELTRTDLTEEVRTKIMFNLGTYELFKDNFLYGLELFLLEGKRLNIWKNPTLPGEFWSGQPAEDRDILVVAEAGIGDEFISVRFLKHLKDRGMRPLWFTDRKDVAQIFEDSGFPVITDMRKRPAGSLWTYSMSLPMYLKLEYNDLWNGPYIKSTASYRDKYKFLKVASKISVGVRWQGNPEYDQDLHRSVALSSILGSIPEVGYNVVSLQRDVGLDELEGLAREVIDTQRYMTDFQETLGILSNLDIVVTTCTSIAHAAAALGKKTFILVPLSAYYVWAHSMQMSPWYGENVTLLRQVKPRSWDAPLKELRTHLEALI